MRGFGMKKEAGSVRSADGAQAGAVLQGCCSRRAQVSLEYLFLIAFALVITLPLILFFFSNASGLTENVNFHQAEKVARELVAAAEKVYFVGDPAQTTLRINMPASIESVDISGREVLLRSRVRNTRSDVYEVSSVNLTGNVSHTEGIKYVLVSAGDGIVTITEVS